MNQVGLGFVGPTVNDFLKHQTRSMVNCLQHQTAGPIDNESIREVKGTNPNSEVTFGDHILEKNYSV